MNLFEMAASVVSTVGDVVRDRSGGDTITREAELQALKERLAVLERGVTDDESSSARLDREFDRLRATTHV